MNKFVGFVRFNSAMIRLRENVHWKNMLSLVSQEKVEVFPIHIHYHPSRVGVKVGFHYQGISCYYLTRL